MQRQAESLVLHAGIRVLLLLSVTIILPWLDGYGLLTLAGLLVVVMTVASFVVGSLWPDALKMLSRLKWFWFAILLLYGWMQPGAGFNGIEAWWMPSVAGLLDGLQRALALAMLVLAVVLVLHTTPREQLLAGLLWLGRPLVWLGVNLERSALRLVLTMEYALEDRPKLLAKTAAGQTMLGEQNNLPHDAPESASSWVVPILTRKIERIRNLPATLRRLGRATVVQLETTEQTAADLPLHPVIIPKLGLPNVLSIAMLSVGWACLFLCVWLLA